MRWFVLGLLACGCAGAFAGDDAPCAVVVELSTDAVGNDCGSDGACCPDGFYFVGFHEGSAVCLGG